MQKGFRTVVWPCSHILGLFHFFFPYSSSETLLIKSSEINRVATDMPTTLHFICDNFRRQRTLQGSIETEAQVSGNGMHFIWEFPLISSFLGYRVLFKASRSKGSFCTFSQGFTRTHYLCLYLNIVNGKDRVSISVTRSHPRNRCYLCYRMSRNDFIFAAGSLQLTKCFRVSHGNSMKLMGRVFWAQRQQ